MDAIKAEYALKGYARIPAVFSQQEVSLIREEGYGCLQRLPKDDPFRLQRVGGRPALLFWPKGLSTYLNDISRDQRLVDIVTAFLGPDVRQINNQLYFREAGDGDEFGWHQDVCFRTPPADFSNVEENYLQTIIVVDKITETNGAVEFIPGSHKWGQLPDLVPRDDSQRGLRKFDRERFRGEKFTAEPGDVLVWSVMAVHGSEQNLSQSNRMTYMNGFAAEAAVLNKTRFPIFTKEGRIV